MKYLFTALFILAAAGTAFGSSHKSNLMDSQTPVGKRKYQINRNAPFTPVRIYQEGEPVPGAFLKDPNFATKAPLSQSPTKIKPAQVAKAPAAQGDGQYIPKKIKFRMLAIKGYKKQPRVTFDREKLVIDRVDEPVPANFFNSVFSDADQL